MANSLDDTLRAPIQVIIGPDDGDGGSNIRYNNPTTNNDLAKAVQPQSSPLLDGLRKLGEYISNLQDVQFSPGTTIGNRLTGNVGEGNPTGERYQTWPERMVREALTASHDVLNSSTPVTSEQLIAPAQALSSLAMTGPAASGVEGALGSGPMKFFSPVEQALESATQKTGPLQQWLGFLKNSKGVKPEELSWLGLESAPELQGNITKQQLQDYVNAHKVDLQEVTKSDKSWDNLSPREQDEWGQTYYEMTGDHAPGRPDWQAVRDFYEESVSDPTSPASNTRYSSYQLPGGENYREHLLTLPYKDINTRVREFAKENNINDIDTAYSEFEKKFGSGNPTFYQSSHWDEPNVLAHIRSNERNVEGVPSLHIEEIQSDWHQQGRKRGYKQDDLKKQYDDLEEKINSYKDHDDPEVLKLIKQQDDIRKSMESGVPDAPFKTSWPELALKRMIQLAAQEGKTRISWTPGEAQAARYDLSKDVSKVYLNNPVWHGENDIRGNLIVTSKANGNDLISKPVKSLKEIEDLIGKEAADRLVNKPSYMQGRDHVLSGDGLKVGGEGMKGFYDKMLPKMVEKLGKQYGVKVKRSPIEADYTQLPPNYRVVEAPLSGVNTDKNMQWHIEGPDGKYLPGSRSYVSKEHAISSALEHLNSKKSPGGLHYFDIPPELAAQATGKGMPLFVGGLPVVPVNHDPFEEKKK